MAHHHLDCRRAHLTGCFDKDATPILTVDPGDTVQYRLMDPAWALGPPAAPDAPWPRLQPRDPVRDAGHALTGPVAIREARPGMTLQVEIDRIEPGPYGWTHISGHDSEFNRTIGIAGNPTVLLTWELDKTRMVGRNPYGHHVDLRPFLGVMGLPPAEPGVHPTGPPRVCGGNLDCRELTAGTSLFLPVTVPGALFCCGDGHARQGDGESCGEAIEAPMDRVDLTFHLHPDMKIAAPRARLRDGWLTFGVDRDLRKAVAMALAGMVDLISATLNVDRQTAFGLASITADVRVTQIVNGVQGAHVHWADNAVR